MRRFHTHTHTHTPNRAAFTLVELLVVIAIIGLLSSIAVVSLGSAKINARNTQRKANLVQISKALEAYNIDNGAYPSTGGSNNWHGDCTNFGSYSDTGAGAWIPNFGAYMAQLPHDPNTNRGSCGTPASSCYLYTSNGTDYKLLAHCTPEGTMLSTDPFYDLARPTWAWSVTNNPSVTSRW